MKKKKKPVKKSAPFRKEAPPRQLKKERWQSLNQNLDQALSLWNEISAQSVDLPSADQKPRHEVKDLLQDLKGQLDQF